MQNKVVLITGASSGIGAGTAVHFASKGCRLSLTGRNAHGLKDTQDKCVAVGAKEENILLLSADLDNDEDIRRIVDQTIQKFGEMDVLVNNAGVYVCNDFQKITLDEYDKVMNTNTRAVFYLTQQAMPHLIKSKGNVVNVSSVAGVRPFAQDTVYCMSKAALDHFTRTTALEMAPNKVRVNGVNPGYVPSNIGRDIDFKIDELVNSMHALGRSGTVEEMAKAIAFLADDEQSAFITGCSLVVDGGLVLMGPKLN